MDFSPMVSLISLILLVIGLAGTFLPALPGLVLSLSGLLLYQFAGGGSISPLLIGLFVILTLTSMALGYLIPARTNKKYGGTKWGSWGSVIGTLAGLVFIPIPFGFLIGMFLGVFLGELLHAPRNPRKALNSVKGSFIGFLYSTSFSFLVGLAMLLIVLSDAWKALF